MDRLGSDIIQMGHSWARHLWPCCDWALGSVCAYASKVRAGLVVVCLFPAYSSSSILRRCLSDGSFGRNELPPAPPSCCLSIIQGFMRFLITGEDFGFLPPYVRKTELLVSSSTIMHKCAP